MIDKTERLTRGFLETKPAKALLGEDSRLAVFSVEVERDGLTHGGANVVKIIPTRLASLIGKFI